MENNAPPTPSVVIPDDEDAAVHLPRQQRRPQPGGSLSARTSSLAMVSSGSPIVRASRTLSAVHLLAPSGTGRNYDGPGNLTASSLTPSISASSAAVMASAAALDVSHAEFDALQGDYDALMREATTLRDDLRAAEDASAAERLAALQLRDELRAERSRARDAETQAEGLAAQVRELRAREARTAVERHASAAAAGFARKSEEEYRAELRDRQREVVSALHEVQALARRVAEVEDENQLLGGEVEATVSELERVTIENNDLRKLMARASQRIEVAESDRDALDRQVKELVEELAKQEAADQTQKLTAELDAVKHRLNESHVAVEDKEQRITKLRAEISTLKSESLEAIVDEMRKTLADKDLEIQRLDRALRESRRDFELLAQDWHKDLVQHEQQQPPSKATQLQQQQQQATPVIFDPRGGEGTQARATALESKLAAMIGQLSAVSEQARRADTAAAAAAIELRDLRLENDQLFSEGPGPYAQRMLADLRSSVAARDTDLDRAKRTINMLQAALDETAEEAGELKSRLGITGALPESDRAHLARRRQTEVGRLTAVVDHMQREIDTLEKERVELKRQVRLQALERGERALKLGLTVDQLYALESLADRMRGNSDITCLCDTHAVRAECAELRDIVARLRSECEGLRARADAARDTAATFVKAAAEAAAATPTIATTTRDVGTRSERSRGASRSRSPRAAYRALSPRRSASTPKPEPTTSTAPVALAPTPPTIIRVTLVERAVMTEDESEQQQLEAPTTTMDSAPAVPEAVETMDQGVDCRLGIEQLPRNVAAHADLPMVAALYHHLVETLQTKQSDGAEHKLLDSQVTAMAQELASVTAGLTTLHAQYTKARESLVEANDRLRIAEHTASDLRSECDALRTSLAAMDAGTTEPVVRELTDLTRQYVVQSVELRAMHRKSIVLQSWYESANAKAEALVADAAGAEERLGKRVLDLGRENGRLQAETAALSARLEESVPSSALIQAQSQARDSQRRHAESEARLAELLVHEMENKRLQESVASLKASLDAAERAHSGARSELAACRAQLEQVHRLEPTHSKQTMDQLRRDLIDRDTRLAIAESQRKLDQIQRTALLDAQRENEALLKTLQQRHDQVQNQNVALVEALQLHQAAALVPAASQGMDNSANNNPHQNHNEDVSVLWLELDALRKQLMHWKSENTTLKNANRRYRQLVADMQLESDQTMLLGQAHLQIADHAAQLATITSRLETTVADNRALELKVSKNDQLIHGLETQNRHLRATLVLHRQEHQLMTTALQSQLAQSVSQQQFQRLKDSLELALQHIRRLADPLPPSTATPAAGMHRVSGHDQDVEHRIELLRLSRQVDELSNLLEFKAREIDHLTATLTDTERTYFETVGLLDKSRAEHQEQLATVTDKLHELEHSLASMSDPAKLMAKLSHAELQITLLATQLEARTATIVKLETSLAASESETRRLDLALLQYQVHANGGGPSSWGEGPPRIESAPAEREDGQGIDSAETVPRAVAQSMVDSIKQQLRYKQLRLEEVEGAHAAVMSQFREKAAKHRKELLHLRNRLTDSSHQLGAAERQIADLSSHVANLEANQRALQQNGECGAVGGLVGAHENGLSTSGSTRALDTDPVAAAASRQSLSSQATSLNSVTRASVAAIFQDQHEQFSLALAEKDQELARIHQELESVGRSWQQQYGQLEHQHTQLLQKRASLLARVEDLEATVRASVPRADYDAMENRALEAQNLLAQARKDASAREERLDKAIQQLKSDLVDLTEREMLLKKAMQRQRLLEKGAGTVVPQCQECPALRDQLAFAAEKSKKSLALKDSTLRSLEKQLQDEQRAREVADLALAAERAPEKIAERLVLSRSLQTANMQIEQLREQHDKLATRLEKAQAKARDLEVAAKVEAPRPEQATATTTGESATALELGAAKDMVKDLQSQLAAAARSRQASARAMAALRERVETLEADLASREAAYAKTTASLTAAVERTQRDERRAKRAATAAEQQAAEARAAVVRLEKMVDRLQSQLSMRTSTVAPKKQAAQQQSSIPVAIAEELEDLRANFEQSVELQVLYEQHLVKLGLDVERIRAEHFGSRESASEPVSAST